MPAALPTDRDLWSPLLLCGALLAVLGGCGDRPQATRPGLAPESAPGFSIGRGVNLTGQFQFGAYSAARLPELGQLRAMGADFIRLPIEPSRFYDPQSPDWAHLDAVLDEAGRVGLKVIVDLHPALNTQRLALTGDGRYPALLRTLAGRLPRWGVEHVALELMNEPIAPSGDPCDPAFDWNRWQKTFYGAARAGSRDLTLILTGACWGGINGLLKVQPIDDPRVVYSVHSYDPMPLTHQGAGWTDWRLGAARQVPYPATPGGAQAALNATLPGLPTARMRAELRATLEQYGQSGFSRATIAADLRRAADWARQNDARLLLGEFGVLQDYAPPQDRVAWLRDVRESAEALGMAHAMWDYNPTGAFGPFRAGQLEAGVLDAIGLTPPGGARPTPPNPAPAPPALANPVESGASVLADFAAGPQDRSGRPTGYAAYGQPQMPTFTPSQDGRAPWQGGHLEFDYNLPLNNDWGGVSATVNVPRQDTGAFSHLRFRLRVTGGSPVRVQLVNGDDDTGGDSPSVTVPTQDDWGWETYTIPLSSFRQEGWGKAVDVAAATKQLDAVTLTVLGVGTSGQVAIDDLALVRVADAASPAPLGEGQGLPVQDFENAGRVTDVSGYQEKPEPRTTFSSSLVPSGNGRALAVTFGLDAAQGWAGVLASTPLAPDGAPLDVGALAALRLDLAATGTRTLRVELSGDTDTGNDHPQVRLTVTPELTTYRLPVALFQQVGWGRAVDVAEVLRAARRVAVYADTVGTRGTFTLDNLVLEQK